MLNSANFFNRFCVLTISEFFFNGFFVLTISEVFLMDFMCRADFAINMAFYKKIKISRAYSLYRVFYFLLLYRVLLKQR
jgi:hypothetical protein